MRNIYLFGYNLAAGGTMKTRTTTVCAGLFRKHALPREGKLIESPPAVDDETE